MHTNMEHSCLEPRSCSRTPKHIWTQSASLAPSLGVWHPADRLLQSLRRYTVRLKQLDNRRTYVQLLGVLKYTDIFHLWLKSVNNKKLYLEFPFTHPAELECSIRPAQRENNEWEWRYCYTVQAVNDIGMASDVVREEICPSFLIVPFKFPSLATSGATTAVLQNGVSNTES
jgi:hypothetical protein